MTFDSLVKNIMKWESDTFFAKGLNLTKEEATKLAEKFIEWGFDRLCGAKLDSWLYDIRGDQE